MDKLTAVTNKQNYRREYIYNGVVLLTSSFESYIVDISGNRNAEERINTKIEAELAAFMKDNKYRLFPQAVELYKESIEKGYPVRPFESVLNYTVTYNTADYLSMYSDRYEYTGGAHGNTLRRSSTYDLRTGRTLPLEAFFPRGFDYATVFLEAILTEARRIMETEPVFFENYEELIVKYFDPDNYYLTEKGVAIYYQQYEIAPYSTGIVVFEIPYESINKVIHPIINIDMGNSEV